MSSENGAEPPKRPKTAVYYFLQRCIKKKIIEESSSYQDRWAHARLLFNKLSDKKKVRYISKAIEDEKRFDKEVQEFLKMHPEYDGRTSCRTVSKSQRDCYDRFNGRPKKPPVTGYLIFSSVVLPILKNMKATERMHKISRLWKNQLHDLVKADYELQSQRANFEYLTAIDAYVTKVSSQERNRIFKEEKIKYPSASKLQTMKVAMDASDEAETMNLDELITIDGLVDDAIVFYSYEKFLNKLQEDSEYEGDDFQEAREEWPSLSESDRTNYLRKVYTCRLIYADTERQHSGKLENFLPSSPITGSIKSDVEALRKILSERPKGKIMNGYALFVSRKLSECDGSKDPRKRMKVIGQMWKDLCETEKQELQYEAKVANERLSGQQQIFESSLNDSHRALLSHYLKKYRKRRDHLKKSLLEA